MIYGTGIDIVKIERIAEMMNRWDKKFLKRIFTEHEIAYCKKKGSSASHFAARFAAKEAAGKMFGTGLGEIQWTDVEVRNNKKGSPFLEFSGRAEKFISNNKIEKVHLSLSHEKEYAVAQVIAEGGQR